MRTAHLLPVSPSMHCLGVYLVRGMYLVPGGVYLPGGCTCLGGAWSRGCTCLGVYLPGGVPAWGCTYPGGYLILAGTWSWGVPAPGGTCPGTPPPVNKILDTHFWKYYLITLPRTSFAGGKNSNAQFLTDTLHFCLSVYANEQLFHNYFLMWCFCTFNCFGKLPVQIYKIAVRI